MVLAVLIGALIFFFRDTSDIFRAAYDASAPTRAKLAMISEWTSADADFFVAIDVPRALANQPLAGRIELISRVRKGVAAELITALLENRGSLGMLAAAGRLGELGGRSDVVVIAQGGFDGDQLVPAVRAAMSAGRSGLAAQDLGWATLYSESDSRNPFGFMLLDSRHIAAGDRQSLLAFYETRPQQGEGMPAQSDDVISGYISIGERMRNSAPKAIYLPEAAYLSSPDGMDISVTIPCGDAEKAQGVLMFLEGLKSLVEIQGRSGGEPGLASAAAAFNMTAEGPDVKLCGKLLPLLDLWAKDAAGEVTPSAEGQAPPQNPPAQPAP